MHKKLRQKKKSLNVIFLGPLRFLFDNKKKKIKHKLDFSKLTKYKSNSEQHIAMMYNCIWILFKFKSMFLCLIWLAGLLIFFKFRNI